MGVIPSRLTIGERSRTHGMSRTRLYHIWRAMLARCQNRNHICYANYGGRGIKVCEQWKSNFAEFAKWAKANGYEDTLTIDRLDNDLGYLPSNCRWIERSEQGKNRRTNHIVIAFGESKTIAEWSRDSRCAVTYDLLQSRLSVYGWAAERAITRARFSKP